MLRGQKFFRSISVPPGPPLEAWPYLFHTVSGAPSRSGSKPEAPCTSLTPEVPSLSGSHSISPQILREDLLCARKCTRYLLSTA